jgi:hypothetical protein
MARVKRRSKTPRPVRAPEFGALSAIDQLFVRLAAAHSSHDGTSLNSARGMTARDWLASGPGRAWLKTREDR